MSNEADTNNRINIKKLPFAVIKIDNQGRLTHVNESFLSLSGFTNDEIINSHINSLLSDDVFEYFDDIQGDEPINLVLFDKAKAQIAIEIKLTSEHSHYFIFITPIANNNLADSAYTGKFIHSAEALGISLKPYWEWNVQEDAIFISAMAMQLLSNKNHPYEAKVGFWTKNIAPEFIEKRQKAIDSVLSGNKTEYRCEYQLNTLAGEAIWLEEKGLVIEYQNNQPSILFGTIVDITKSKNLISDLKKQNAYLLLAEKLSHAGHWRIDVTTGEVFLSRGVYLIHGVDPKKAKVEHLNSECFHDEKDLPMYMEHYKAAIKNKAGFYFKHTITRDTGSKIKIEVIADVEMDDLGNVIAVFGVIRDISKQEQTFEKLKLLAMVNYTINVPIFFLNELDNVVYQDLTVKLSSKISGLFDYINFSFSDYIALKKTAKKIGQVKKNSVTFDQFQTVYNISVTYEPDAGIYIWIVENITLEFRKEQQQLISKRLTLLGNTFGNVSHDINNVLGVALGSIEMLELKLAQGDSNIDTYVERVKNAISKGKSVTERLLNFTRKPSVKLVKFDPNKDIRDNKYIFEHLFLHTIKLTVTLEETPCAIFFPQGEFINILLNIILNARDAIEEQGISGEIHLSTELTNYGYFLVHIKDSGVGIAEQNLTKIFDPFYTSKSVHKGSGIGLANVYDTIYKYNGAIQVLGRCDLGGAQFTLKFQSADASGIKGIAENKPLDLQNKSILVLDDEESIAEFVAMFLSNQGADVKACNDKVGLEAFVSDMHTCDIFITDMILPELNGREATNIVLAKFPQARIYSMSGYIAEEEQNWEYPVLRKPFNSYELSEFISSS
ncbi:MAG: ATP-binding protein [Thalassotalea sp.]